MKYADTKLPQERKLTVFVLDDASPGFYESLGQVYIGLAQFRKLRNADAALAELSETDPDILIANLNHPGLDALSLLRFLALKKVRYPLLLVTAADTLELYEDFCRNEYPRLNVVLMEKLNEAELFYQHLARCIARLSTQFEPVEAPPLAVDPALFSGGAPAVNPSVPGNSYPT